MNALRLGLQKADGGVSIWRLNNLEPRIGEKFHRKCPNECFVFHHQNANGLV